MPIYTCYNSWHRFTFTIYSFIEIIINLKFVETVVKFAWLPVNNIYDLETSVAIKTVLLLGETWWNEILEFRNFAFEEGDRNNFFFSIRRKKIRRNCQETSVHSLSRHFSPPKLELGTMLGERGTDVENYLRQERRGEGSDLAGL